MLVYQNNEMAAILVYGTGISSFSFKYFLLFHHPTGATDHVSENDLLDTVMSKYTARRISGIYRAEKRRAIEMAPSPYFSISRNIEGHNIEDKIHCTVSKPDETFFEIFFNHL
jgi:hypothetical protein